MMVKALDGRGKAELVRSPLTWLLVAFALLGLLYINSVPPFESPDEPFHFAYVDYIRAKGQLPIRHPGEKTYFKHEGSQPPLYYLLAAAVISPFPRGNLAEIFALNPHAVIGDPSTDNNYNRHALANIRVPVGDGAMLALFSARLLSLLLGIVTVSAVWLTARELAPAREGVALLAAALTAFNPQFLFISASVNNDNLITALGSLLIWQMLRLLRHGFQPRRNWALAILLALACLTKLTGLLFAPTLLLVAGYRAWRCGEWRKLLHFFLLLAVTWLVVAGWWYARNLILYGEFTGARMLLDLYGRRSAPSLRDLIGEEFTGLRISYWGLFGWFNVFTVQEFYLVMDIVLLLGAAGVLIWLWRRPQGERLAPFLLLAGQLVFVIAGLVTYTSQAASSQGRLIFPAIATISTLLALGLRQWRLPARPLAVALGAFALAVPFVSIRPAYRSPPSFAQLPESATRFHARFYAYEEIELLGYELRAERYEPGEALSVALYWRPTAASALNYSIFLDLLADDGVIAQVITFPGHGNLSTSRWQAGRIYEDRYEMLLPKDLLGSSPLRLHIGWWKYPGGYRLPAYDGEGGDLPTVIVGAGAYVASEDVPSPSAEFLAEPLEYDGVRLLAYELEDENLTFWWEVTTPLAEDFHILVHVLAAEFSPGGSNPILMQGDAAPPLPTGYWRVGERFLSRHTLRRTETGETAEAGQYPLYVGWYSTTQVLQLDADCPDEACWLRDIWLTEGAKAD